MNLKLCTIILSIPLLFSLNVVICDFTNNTTNFNKTLSSSFTHYLTGRKLVPLDINETNSLGYRTLFRLNKIIFKAEAPFLFCSIKQGDISLWRSNHCQYPDKVILKPLGPYKHILKVCFPLQPHGPHEPYLFAHTPTTAKLLVDLNVESRWNTKYYSYKKLVQFPTFVPNDGYSFKSVNLGGQCVWKSNNSAEYADKVELTKTGKVIIHLPYTGIKRVRTQVYGHRGMGPSTDLRFSLYAENGITSFSKALENGADGIEFDVFLTDLGEVVVCHGLDPLGLAYLNLLDYSSGQLEQFPRDLSIENLKVSHDKVVLKAPWTYKGASTSDEMSHLVSQLSESEKNKLSEEYVTSNVGYVPEGSSDYERLPTLEQVFEKFGGKLKYNVELKGTKVQLGVEVLKIIKKFNNLDVFISSFGWIPPPLTVIDVNTSHDRLNELPAENSNYRPTKELEADINMKLQMRKKEEEEKMNDLAIEKYPNGSQIDLLKCLVKNELNVPLGLLFDFKESLPSVDRILEMVKKYDASYINIADSFWIKKKPIVNSELKSEAALRHLVKQMHSNNVKVLTWSVSPFDYSKHFHVYVDANVDIVCINSVKEVIEFHRQYHPS